ncbi:ABC-three component system protein [Clostridiisalibacter paucivorans]|uniref:ABC-three component system protein n=1 Tax=Clostridiisalibacter paucivorans TaxID=408753 RepID=UPI000A036F4C|nr:ABC-three component system protein [Clostridiisalibacter paucivorans]
MSRGNLIKELQNKYREGNIVPFLGAGLSIPFNIPDWNELIKECAVDMGIENVSEMPSLVDMLNFNLKNYDYWEAVRLIKKYLNRSEEDIQEFIVNKINDSIPDELINIDNNYEDLGKYGFNLYFTTNYDHIMSKYLNSNFMPVNLKDVQSNIQSLINNSKTKRIFHLHGNISDSSSIVISHEKYKELYDDNVYKSLFSVFSGVKTFLFIGFSFNDVFIQNIIKDNNEYFKSKHYIILPKPTNENIRHLKQNYNIETIPYNPEDSSHCEEIRKILIDICSNTTNNIGVEEIHEEDLILDKLPNKEEKSLLEKNIFCQKLRIEDIDELKVDYSKECFFTAEQYFRWLKKSGIKGNSTFADHFLALTYMKYRELLISLYSDEKNSDNFFKAVHKAMIKLEFSKLNNRINYENMPNEINKQGFIHILADDLESEKEVWWGEKRLGQE